MTEDPRTYIKVHDGIVDHPKIIGLSDAAFRTLVECWCYCSRHLTDGIIPDAALRKMGTPRARGELVQAEMLEALDDFKWAAHDYLQHQRSAAEVSELRSKRRAAGLASAAARAQQKGSKRPTLVKQDVEQTGNNAATETETETEELPKGSSLRGKRATKAPMTMTLSDEMRLWAASETPDVRLVVETARMLDWHRANGKTKTDWLATWRNWMRKAQGDATPSSSAAVGFARSDVAKQFG